MTYARFGNDSDVYVWDGLNGLYCTACRLGAAAYNEFGPVSEVEMVHHLSQHVLAGHKVPGRAVARLMGDPDWQKFGSVVLDPDRFDILGSSS